MSSASEHLVGEPIRLSFVIDFVTLLTIVAVLVGG